MSGLERLPGELHTKIVRQLPQADAHALVLASPETRAIYKDIVIEPEAALRAKYPAATWQQVITTDMCIRGKSDTHFDARDTHVPAADNYCTHDLDTGKSMLIVRNPRVYAQAGHARDITRAEFRRHVGGSNRWHITWRCTAYEYRAGHSRYVHGDVSIDAGMHFILEVSVGQFVPFDYRCHVLQYILLLAFTDREPSHLALPARSNVDVASEATSVISRVRNIYRLGVEHTRIIAAQTCVDVEPAWAPAHAHDYTQVVIQYSSFFSMYGKQRLSTVPTGGPAMQLNAHDFICLTYRGNTTIEVGSIEYARKVRDGRTAPRSHYCKEFKDGVFVVYSNGYYRIYLTDPLSDKEQCKLLMDFAAWMDHWIEETGVTRERTYVLSGAQATGGFAVLY